MKCNPCSPQHVNTIRGRIQSKSDTTSNWNKTKNFIPLKGEIIIYTDYKGAGKPAIKIGDGKTDVKKLEFLSAESVIKEVDFDDLSDDLQAIILSILPKDSLKAGAGINIENYSNNVVISIEDNLILDCGTSEGV